MCGSLPNRSDPLWQSRRQKESRSPSFEREKRVPFAGAYRHGTKGLLPVERGLGASVGGVGVGAKCRRPRGGATWLAAFSPTGDGLSAERSELRFHDSRCG